MKQQDLGHQQGGRLATYGGVGGPQALSEGTKGFFEDTPIHRLRKGHQGVLALVQSLLDHLFEEQFPLSHPLKPPLLVGFGVSSPGSFPGGFNVPPQGVSSVSEGRIHKGALASFPLKALIG